jgi:hypothetical protein
LRDRFRRDFAVITEPCAVIGCRCTDKVKDKGNRSEYSVLPAFP